MLENLITEFIHPEDVKILSRQFDLSARRVAAFQQHAGWYAWLDQITHVFDHD